MSYSEVTGQPLDELLAAAIEGGRAAVEKFYRGLFAARVFVPRRFQAMPLSDSPSYPNDFIDLLGVNDKTRVVVPVFTGTDLVREWSGTEFALREITFVELAGLLPEQWWVVLNPGSEIEKEFTPWEIEHIRAGEQSLPILVEEALAHEGESGLSFSAVGDEFAKLKEVLAQFAATVESIEAVYLLQRERGEHSDSLPSLVVGVRTTSIPTTEQEGIRSDAAAVAEQALIGSATVQVMLGGALGASMLDEVFQGFSPIYIRAAYSDGLTAKVQRWFSRLLA